MQPSCIFFDNSNLPQFNAKSVLIDAKGQTKAASFGNVTEDSGTKERMHQNDVKLGVANGTTPVPEKEGQRRAEAPADLPAQKDKMAFVVAMAMMK